MDHVLYFLQLSDFFSTNMHTICHVLAMWVLDTDILGVLLLQLLFLSRTGKFDSG